MSYYQADQIENKRNLDSSVARFWAARCGFPIQSESVLSAIARQQLALGEQETRNTLQILRNLVRIMAPLPGQRIIVLISPGFITPHLEYEFSGLIDLALRSQVVISTLDARGVYVNMPGENPLEQSANSEVLAFLAEGTGGDYFHGNNDMMEGLKNLVAAPEYSYYLGFAPQGLKPDGKYHKLSVRLRQELKVQARPGYYAPKRNPTN